jgi:hypothetical protein
MPGPRVLPRTQCIMQAFDSRSRSRAGRARSFARVTILSDTIQVSRLYYDTLSQLSDPGHKKTLVLTGELAPIATAGPDCNLVSGPRLRKSNPPRIEQIECIGPISQNRQNTVTSMIRSLIVSSLATKTIQVEWYRIHVVCNGNSVIAVPQEGPQLRSPSKLLKMFPPRIVS